MKFNQNRCGGTVTYTYTPPKRRGKPFVRGELVEVCHSDLTVMNVVKVVYAGTKVVRLEDGRRFRASDGWWIGETGTWPFPSIRHAKKKTKGKSNG